LLKQAELAYVTFHSLRHTANSLLIEAGEDPLAIAGSLGHSDTRMMFERYGHLFNHTAKRVAQTADRIFATLERGCRKGGPSLRAAAERKTAKLFTE
jgi:integrase